MNNKHFLQSNADSIPGIAHLRKAYYMSGWDWGPKLPDMGIFRPVELDAYDGDRIESIFVRQHHGAGKVTLSLTVETRHGTPCDATVSVVDAEEGAVIEIASDTFAKGVYLEFADTDPILSTNFFDLTDGEAQRVTVKTDKSAAALAQELKILTVYDIGR